MSWQMFNNRNVISIIFIILLFSSCTHPKVVIANNISETPAQTITTVLVQQPTEKPTATPFVPLTLEEIEAKLEADLGKELEYGGKDTVLSDFLIFKNENAEYRVDNQTGEIIYYLNRKSDNEEQNLIDEEEAKQIAINVLLKLCSEFFEYDYYLESRTPTEYSYSFYFYQLSPHGRRTGNHVSATIQNTGTLSHYFISNWENPTSVDEDISITKQKAIEITYKKAKQEYTLINKDGEDVTEKYFDDYKNHTIETYLGRYKGNTVWYVEISNIKDVWADDVYLAVAATIDADTGEIYFIDRTK